MLSGLNTRFLMLAMAITLLALPVRANDTEGAWKQSQLNEPFMRSLTKHQCMSKTVSSLKAVCKDDSCFTTLAGITGDCTTWAQGSMEEFCSSFESRYLSRYCWTNELDARSCMFLTLSRSVSCRTDQTFRQ